MKFGKKFIFDPAKSQQIGECSWSDPMVSSDGNITGFTVITSNDAGDKIIRIYGSRFVKNSLYIATFNNGRTETPFITPLKVPENKSEAVCFFMGFVSKNKKDTADEVTGDRVEQGKGFKLAWDFQESGNGFTYMNPNTFWIGNSPDLEALKQLLKGDAKYPKWVIDRYI